MRECNVIPEGELKDLCCIARVMTESGKYEECETLLCTAMGQHPHAAEPHNLMGILLERTGDHANAMKHFRAAWALDPTYRPAEHNLELYGTFRPSGRPAFADSDLLPDNDGGCMIAYDACGIGRVVHKRCRQIS